MFMRKGHRGDLPGVYNSWIVAPPTLYYVSYILPLARECSLILGEREYALQRTTTENSKQIIPEKELRGHRPDFHIHVSVCDLHIYVFPRSICLLWCRKYVDRSGEYINRSHTHECGNWAWGRAISRKVIYKWVYRCSVESQKYKLGDIRKEWPHTQARQKIYQKISEVTVHIVFTVYSKRSIQKPEADY